jgi:MerR family transcriptional regulator/heat shock protein HspR
MARSKAKAAYMISVVAEQNENHPQNSTPLRARRPVEAFAQRRQHPSLHARRSGASGSDSPFDSRLGVNLAGVEIILNMREKMGEMQSQIQQFIASLNSELAACTASRSTPPA